MIFNIFKSKPTLKELIPNGFVDIHSHILPGVDDGAKNINESLELISEMKKMGFSKIIGTPHTYLGLYDNTNEIIKESFELLSEKNSIDIKISYASEYMLDLSIMERIEDKSLLTLKENYVLVEMSYISSPSKLYDIIFKMNLNDYIPVIAHPERYLYLLNDLNEFKKLKRFGCKFQINLLSICGYYGKNTTILSEYLLANDIIDYVGSDVHNKRHINIINSKKLSKIKINNKYLDVIENSIENTISTFM
tara:strand:+ start:182 stop:931 length:750 start_codon:yes stop_codon:yes gene_type:complete